ncbi:MAG: WYL domain-containing protein [Planctomycetia bacterium]|nr:WYL domain-containing protein [Planctomycetia bacterium]
MSGYCVNGKRFVGDETMRKKETDSRNTSDKPKKRVTKKVADEETMVSSSNYPGKGKKKSIPEKSETKVVRRGRPPKKKVDEEEENNSESLARRVIRVLRVLQYLQEDWYSVRVLSQKLNCSERSIYRDFESIETILQIQLTKNIRSQYRLISKEGRFFLTLDLTCEEALALYLLCLACGNDYASIPYLEATQSAIYKLSCLFSEEFRVKKQDGTLQRMSIQGCATAFPSEDGRIFHQILYAHNNRLQVRMEYDSVFERKTIVTTLLPYHLHFTRRAWYITGRSTLHNAIRTFHIERIRSLTVTNERFTVPLGWSYEKSLGNAWCMIREEKDTKVHLRFSAKVAPNVRSVRWHRTGRFDERADGTLDYYLEVSGLEEIQWWILGYGDQVEVLRPPELRDKIIEHVKNMTKIYQS